ncbi:hypothetical protein ACJX0J_027608, partial [Zea mays]
MRVEIYIRSGPISLSDCIVLWQWGKVVFCHIFNIVLLPKVSLRTCAYLILLYIYLYGPPIHASILLLKKCQRGYVKQECIQALHEDYCTSEQFQIDQNKADILTIISFPRPDNMINANGHSKKRWSITFHATCMHTDIGNFLLFQIDLTRKGYVRSRNRFFALDWFVNLKKEALYF